MTGRLLVDVGNTRSKWWWQARSGVYEEGASVSSPDALAESLCDAGVMAPEAALASVAEPAADADYERAVTEATGARVFVCRTTDRSLGLTNSYPEPQTMGVDRWLAMMAAWHRIGGAVCVVDAGTALTIDLVASDGRHEGGYIIPGTQLMQQTLSDRARRISITPTDQASLAPGTSTQGCVTEGAWLAAVSAVREVMRQRPDHKLVVCGGDGQRLLQLGLNGEWAPHLVRDGLSLWLASQLAGGESF